MNKIANLRLRYQFILLSILGFLLFSNIFSNTFTLDDSELIGNNKTVTEQNFQQIFFGGTFYRGDDVERGGQFYRPLMLLVFSLSDWFFGVNFFVLHTLSILFHLANTLLLLIVLRRFLTSALAFALSILFLVLPINSEVVNAMASINDSMYVTFGLAAFIFVFYISRFKTQTSTLILTILLALSLFSKETGVLFCAMVFCYYFFFKVKNYALVIAPIISLIGYLVFRMLTVGLGIGESGIAPMMRATLGERLLTVPKIIVYYLQSTFLPLSIARGQHWVVSQPSIQDFFLPIFIVLVFGAMLIFLWTRFRGDNRDSSWFLFFLLWFCLGIGFHAQIIPLEYTVGDRWFYFSIIGLLGIIGLSLKRVRLPLVIPILLVLSLLYGIRTYVRNLDWKSQYVLTAHDIQTNTNSFELEHFYGVELLKQRKYDSALYHLQRSVDLNPYWLNINNLATAHLALGNKEKALELFAQSAHEYKYFKAFENLASVHLFAGNFDESKKAIDEGLSYYPKDAKLWQILALYYEKTNNPEKMQQAQSQYQYLKSHSASTD